MALAREVIRCAFCPPVISNHPWSITLKSRCVWGRVLFKRYCEEIGDRNHIKERACWNIEGAGAEKEGYGSAAETINSPSKVTSRGRSFCIGGKGISWIGAM